jgi:hypothetical protein
MVPTKRFQLPVQDNATSSELLRTTNEQRQYQRIRKTSKTRMEEDAKYRWHGARGASEINYCDFGDLSSIIVTNWDVFEDLLGNLEWVKAILTSLEKSRNIVMHSGSVAKEDVERIGMNIRDWIRQAG